MLVRITRAVIDDRRVLPAGLVLDLDVTRAKTLIAVGAAIAAEARVADEPFASPEKPKRDKRA